MNQPHARTVPIETVVGGAVFLTSGAALVVHILTDRPLPIILAGIILLAGAGALAVFRGRPVARATWFRHIRAGVVAGIVSTAVYDASRWILVELGGFRVSPFKSFPFFGEALLGSSSTMGMRQVAGVTFHLLNGIAFATAYTVWFGRRTFWWGIAFGLGLEAMMLSLYPGWLDIRAMREFTQMSVFGHVAYGAALGLTCRRALRVEP